MVNRAQEESALRPAETHQDTAAGAVLCLPVVKQSTVIGVVYLENRLSESAFAASKTQTTELLMSQVAISLENSRLVQEMKKAEDRVRRSLAEKEVLLKEIHHRVKNNLQIVHSMLNLQLPYVEDAKALEVFRDCQTRIYSIALIHEKLYQSESLSQIDLAAYFRSLSANLFVSYGVNDLDVRAEIRVDSIPLPINTLIPCALIVNELVSNALKHAFPPARLAAGPGKIRISLQSGSGGRVILAVEDNGVGLPKGFDLQGQASLGLRLVSVLARQLGGTLRQRSGGGTGLYIEFTNEPDRGGQDRDRYQDPGS